MKNSAFKTFTVLAALLLMVALSGCGTEKRSEVPGENPAVTELSDEGSEAFDDADEAPVDEPLIDDGTDQEIPQAANEEGNQNPNYDSSIDDETSPQENEGVSTKVDQSHMDDPDL